MRKKAQKNAYVIATKLMAKELGITPSKNTLALLSLSIEKSLKIS